MRKRDAGLVQAAAIRRSLVAFVGASCVVGQPPGISRLSFSNRACQLRGIEL